MTRLSSLAVAICFAMQSASVSAQGEDLDRAELWGSEVALRAYSGMCGFVMAQSVLILDIPAPCRFLRVVPGGDVREVTLATGEGPGPRVAAVAGPRVHPDDLKAAVEGLDNRYCSHMAQGLINRGGQVANGAVLLEPLGFCSDLALDQMAYYGFVPTPVISD